MYFCVMRVSIGKFLCLVASTYLLSSCSVIYRFMLVNKSKEPVQVQYRVKSLRGEWNQERDSVYRDVFHSPLRYKGRTISEIPHRFDEKTNTFSFVLPAKSRAKIGTARNTAFGSIVEGNSLWRWRCNLDYLQIKTSTQETTYSIEDIKRILIENRTYNRYRSKMVFR